MESLIARFLIILLLHTGCERNTEKQVSADWIQSPRKMGLQDLRFRLSADSQPLTKAQVSVEANMNHPGMAPVYGKAKESEPGVYSVKLDLQMAGDWIFFLEGSSDGKKIKASLNGRINP